MVGPVNEPGGDGRPIGLEAQAEALASGGIGAVELTEATLAAADAGQARLNCFRVIRHEAVLAEAREAARRIESGERAPLLGVPVVIKDDTDLTGETTMFGCPGNFQAKAEDAELVKRLRAAGALIVGKTTTPELGQWPYTEGEAFGITRNPWDLSRTPGGSSGGTSAAVAAGIVAAGVGSDGAGSVRIPASWCGLVGLKPQRGRISTWPEAEAFNGLTCHGPIARSVADAALLLDVLTGNHPSELHKPVAPPVPFAEAAAREPGKLRIAISLDPPFCGFPTSLDPSVRQRIETVAVALRGLGHTVETHQLKFGLVGLGLVPRGTEGIAEWVEQMPDPELLDPRTREAASTGRKLRGLPLALARRAEGLLQSRIGEVFDSYDIVLTPTTARPPAEAGVLEGLSTTQTDKQMIADCPYAYPWNVLGWPGLSVPAGFVGGVPVGAQLLGPEASEGLLLSLGAQLEQELGWTGEWPSAWREAPVPA